MLSATARPSRFPLCHFSWVSFLLALSPLFLFSVYSGPAQSKLE